MEDIIYGNRSNSKQMSEDIRLLGQAFIAAKKEFVATGKSARNDHQKYYYATLEDIYGAVDEALLKHNIWIVHRADFLEDRQEVLYTRLIHVLSGQWIEDARLLISEKPGNQGRGAANTYSKKYAVLSLCAIPTEDDDGEEEQKFIAKRAAEPKISLEQKKELVDEMRPAVNNKILYAAILKDHGIKDLAELKLSSLETVKSYIITNKE